MSMRRGEEISLLGESPVIVALRREIREAARTHAKVLILGETGVGKEVVANLVHRHSARQNRAFLALNCSGIPETLLESELFGHVRGSFTGAYRDKPGFVRQAEGGTLFLDELGEMSLRMQAVLLRFTETGEVQPVGADRPGGRVDVRLITATNRDLRAQINDGKFREDLYYRLNVIQIRVPPLRERASDVPLLLRHFLEQASNAHQLPCPELTPEAEAAVREYAWPGNVRELKNLTERLVVRDMQRAITLDDLPAECRTAPAPRHRAADETPAAAPQAAATVATGRTLPTGAPASAECSPMVDVLWRRMLDGEHFWMVAELYKGHEITRADLRMLIHLGLQRTRGNYRALLTLFNLPAADYKRFQAFLFQHKCNLPFRPYRSESAAAAVPQAPAARPQYGVAS